MRLHPTFNPCVGAVRGFALVITLSLMVLLTVIAVGLLTLSSVSIRSASHANAMASARANARLALMLAIGDLQKNAGPDQRVTARADLSASVANPLYTGVWDSRAAILDKAAPLAWLVSGNNTTGLTTTPLVSATNGGTEVRAPIQYVKSTTASQPTGAFAYWVSDEGVKARINLESPGYRTNVSAMDAARAFAGAPRSAIELMERSATASSGTVASAWGSNLYPYVAETTSKLLTTGQLPLYTTAGNQAATKASAKARFHDLTAYSSTVLANTADGGLRQDLTRILSDPAKPGPSDTDFIFSYVGSLLAEVHRRPPTWGRLREWWNNPIDPKNGILTPSLPTASTPPVAPVVMWAELGLAFYAEDLSTATPPGSGYRLRVQAFPRAILWNPYTVPMAGRSYEFGIRTIAAAGGLSDSVILEGVDGTTVGSYYLNRYSFNPSDLGKYIRFKITVPKLEPGQATSFSISGSMDDTLETGDYPGNYTVLDNFPSDWLITSIPPPYRLRIPTSPQYGGHTGFYLRDEGQGDPGIPTDTSIPSRTYQFANIIGFSQNGITGVGEFVSLPPIGATAIQPQLRVVNVAGMDNGHIFIRWMANGNQLAPFQVRHSADTSSNSTNRSNIFGPGQYLLPSTPTGDVSISTNLSSTVSSNGTPFRMVLREPRLLDSGQYQSVAQLQHAPLNDTAVGPLNVVGNSLQNPRIPIRSATSVVSPGDTLTSPLYDSSYLVNQALWDKYFLSTIPDTLTADDLKMPGFKLPNSRLQALEITDIIKLKKHDAAAANMVMLGGFNINSTSEQAWRAVLGAAHNLKYDPLSGELAPSGPLTNPFSRFLRPGGDSNDHYRGYRQLTEAQIAALAAAIVVEVRARGPFRSLADFVNRRLVGNNDVDAATGLKGALQAAIDAADLDAVSTKQINNIAPYNTSITKTFDTGSPPKMDKEAWQGVAGTNPKSPISSLNVFGPGYLTQADVLCRIGSAITARSDTFVIRVYGEARNSAGVVEARARAEAVVQRVPEYIDSSAPPEVSPTAGSLNERFGRRFNTVSFRWLRPNEF